MIMIPLSDVRQDVAAALKEDVGSGDLSAALLDPAQKVTARVVTRESMVLCGTPWFTETFKQLDTDVAIRWHYEDGGEVEKGSCLCDISGPCAPLLTGERTALNFLQMLSGTATITRRYVDALAGQATKLLDTRKTVPGLRMAQKYAVLCGGGMNHRLGLYDAILIKENHIKAAGSIEAAVTRARTLSPGIMIEVEVESLEELKHALALQVDRVMLDNFTEPMLEEALQFDRGQTQFELSGNVTLDTIRSWSRCGVDFISVGAITKHVQAIDLSLQLIALNDAP